MTVDAFFDIFLKELEAHPEMRAYYRFLNNESLFEFRKAYFIQRLQYIADNAGSTDSRIFDVGCGYGTTGFFLALNGYKVYGTTIEFYYDQIARRFDFWAQYGDVSGFEVAYENLFDSPPAAAAYDVVIAQDVLHHLEPLDRALQIIHSTLKPGGKLIACEENGNNLMNSARLFLKRGNKRVKEIYDEKLQKNILIGDENIRSIEQWKEELANSDLHLVADSVEYVRLYPPQVAKKKGVPALIEQEQKVWKKNAFAKKYLFHGVNFVATKVH
jgi:SAM-dependent methyltransferase